MRRSILALFTLILTTAVLLPTRAQAELPIRPTLQPTATPAAILTPVPTAKPLPLRMRGGNILLYTEGHNQPLWTVVQWQGEDGAWHDVDGWKGWTTNGVRSWWVHPQHLGSETPYRWTLYDNEEGTLITVSDSFFLPKAATEEAIVRTR